jgi:tetratricopeptide (TPR) repeat protein
MFISMEKMKMRRFFVLFLVIPAIAALAGACERANNPNAEKVDPYYIIGSGEDREHFRDLLTLLADKNNSAENTFAITREIANGFSKAKEYGKLIHFISERTINFPEDPYSSYYFLMIAFADIQQNSQAVAARYFDLIVKNYPDLTVNDESIHLACLNQLIELNDNPEQQVWYYQELITRFSERIELGEAWFMLAQAYERIGDWNSAIQAYARYLPYAGTIIPGFLNADNYARQQVDFNNSLKDWTYENLSTLLSRVRSALDDADPYQLELSQAKVNFFARSWGQGETDDTAGMVDFGEGDFNLSDFMLDNRIHYADKLDSSSNATEAYLRTWGWSQYISTWYLYFRKIYFPSDPEIHGRWECAGVYYGEKF